MAGKERTISRDSSSCELFHLLTYSDLSVPFSTEEQPGAFFVYSESPGKASGFAHTFPCAVQYAGFMVTWNKLSSKPSGPRRWVGGENLKHGLRVGMMPSAEVACKLYGRFQSHRHLQVRCHSPCGNSLPTSVLGTHSSAVRGL